MIDIRGNEKAEKVERAERAERGGNARALHEIMALNSMVRTASSESRLKSPGHPSTSCMVPAQALKDQLTEEWG